LPGNFFKGNYFARELFPRGTISRGNFSPVNYSKGTLSRELFPGNFEGTLSKEIFPGNFFPGNYNWIRARLPFPSHDVWFGFGFWVPRL
jgi:hypothetical protein